MRLSLVPAEQRIRAGMPWDARSILPARRAGAAGGQQRFAFRNAGEPWELHSSCRELVKVEPCGTAAGSGPGERVKSYSGVSLRKCKRSLGRFLLHLSSGF